MALETVLQDSEDHRVRPKYMEAGVSPLRRKDKVCVCYIVAASFKVGLSGHKQRFLVNQCLLSCCINTITTNTNDQSIWAQNFKLFWFLVQKWWRNFGLFSSKMMGMLDFQVQVL